MDDRDRDDERQEHHAPDRRPYGDRDNRVNRPYRDQTWELSPSEIGQVKWLLWGIGVCAKAWGALVIGVLIGLIPMGVAAYLMHKGIGK